MKSLQININSVICFLLIVILILVIMCCIKNKNEYFRNTKRLNKIINIYKHGPKSYTNFYKKWDKKGRCHKTACISNKYKYKILRDKALSDMGSDANICDLKLCEGCTDCNSPTTTSLAPTTTTLAPTTTSLAPTTTTLAPTTTSLAPTTTTAAPTQDEITCESELKRLHGDEAVCLNGGKCKFAINNFAKGNDPKEIAYCDCGTVSYGRCFYGPWCENTLETCTSDNVCNIRDKFPSGNDPSKAICGNYKYPKFKKLKDKNNKPLCINTTTNILETCKS
jgi:hypothetical protein